MRANNPAFKVVIQVGMATKLLGPLYFLILRPVFDKTNRRCHCSSYLDKDKLAPGGKGILNYLQQELQVNGAFLELIYQTCRLFKTFKM